MIITKGQPTVPTGPSTYTPVKAPDVADMEHFHKMATSGTLANIMLKLGGGKRK
jgi:hypothetical protein